MHKIQRNATNESINNLDSVPETLQRETSNSFIGEASPTKRHVASKDIVNKSRNNIYITNASLVAQKNRKVKRETSHVK